MEAWLLGLGSAEALKPAANGSSQTRNSSPHCYLERQLSSH